VKVGYPRKKKRGLAEKDQAKISSGTGEQKKREVDEMPLPLLGLSG